MNKRYLLWAALIIAAVIAVRPMFWLGLIGFIGLMVVLAVFVVLVIIYLLSLKKGSVYQEIGFGLLIIITVCSVIALKFSTPELSAGEVKAIFSHPPIEGKPEGDVRERVGSPGQEAVSAEYKGNGIWRVKIIQEGNTYYLYYDENKNQIKN